MDEMARLLSTKVGYLVQTEGGQIVEYEGALHEIGEYPPGSIALAALEAVAILESS